MAAISSQLTFAEFQSAYCSSLDNFRDKHKEAENVNRVVENLKTVLSYYYTNKSFHDIRSLQDSSFKFIEKINGFGNQEKLSARDQLDLRTLFINQWHRLDLDHALSNQVSKVATSNLSFPLMQTEFMAKLDFYAYCCLDLEPKELRDFKVSLATNKIKDEFSCYYPGSQEDSIEEGSEGFMKIIEEVGKKEKLSQFHIMTLKAIFSRAWSKL